MLIFFVKFRTMGRKCLHFLKTSPTKYSASIFTFLSGRSPLHGALPIRMARRTGKMGARAHLTRRWALLKFSVRISEKHDFQYKIAKKPSADHKNLPPFVILLTVVFYWSSHVLWAFIVSYSSPYRRVRAILVPHIWIGPYLHRKSQTEIKCQLCMTRSSR